jgi:hypothetical protein
MIEALLKRRRQNDPGLRLQALRDQLQLSTAEIEEYRNHVRTIARRMDTSYPGSALVVIGSFSRGTANGSGLSDVDLLLKVPREVAHWGSTRISSETVLNKVRVELTDRYTATTIRRDGQAVVVNFGGGRFAVDVVPGIFEQMVSPLPEMPSRPAFLIPDGAGGWLRTSPEAHNKFISQADIQSGGKLTYVIQMVKFWRDCRAPSYQLLSFYVELLAAAEGSCVGVKSYSRCLYEVFKALKKRECRPMRDPLGISQSIKAAGTEGQRRDLMNAVDRACNLTAAAAGMEAVGKHDKACEFLDVLFNRKLPPAP